LSFFLLRPSFRTGFLRFIGVSGEAGAGEESSADEDESSSFGSTDQDCFGSGEELFLVVFCGFSGVEAEEEAAAHHLRAVLSFTLK
jgi:hypothetical protein